MEEGAAKRLIQIGIRTMTGHQREQASKFGVEVIEMRHLPALDRMKVDGPIYIRAETHFPRFFCVGPQNQAS